MCGIFGIIANKQVDQDLFINLGKLSERRGRDSSGVLYYDENTYSTVRADKQFSHLISDINIPKSKVIFGHSRLITNGQADNQPVVRNNVAIIHNGIITNDNEYWERSGQKRLFMVDSEALLGVTLNILEKGLPLEDIFDAIQDTCKGSFSCALILPGHGKLILMSNTGSLYTGLNIENSFCFASERVFLEKTACLNIKNILGYLILDIPVSLNEILVSDQKVNRQDLIPSLGLRTQEENKLIFPETNLRRCTCCILPETMPFITFNSDGVCNYCINYRPRNNPKPRSSLDDLLSRYSNSEKGRCIMPFSGGRDSSFALHLITKEFGLRPITMTYDWGMVTDLARRNISRMCAELGVENILIADDIVNKRRNIRLNLVAWLKKPDLGMINILMAGDKHFFRHIDTIKRETGISLNIWGMNPLEVTHFKAGFLGFQPEFATKQVFYTGLMGQLKYQGLRAKKMIDNPSYLNSSLWDTISGEYFRSVKKQTDFYNLFDFWHWDETEVNTAIESYGWERAVDTNSTWRIGDGTAAFYNYVYYTMAGFTEYDTFRSNQIREGQLNRERALELVAEENRPRYQNIKWYLDVVEMNFGDVIDVINNAPRVY